MKLKYMIPALLAALTLAMTGCGSDPLYYRYDTDLSQYITLGQYEGLPATPVSLEVSEELIQTQIDSTVSFYAHEHEITDRGAKIGDTVKFSLTAEIDGAAAQDFAQEEGSMMLGFDSYGADADDALTGAKAGDVVTAEMTLPEDDRYGENAGKTVDMTFSVTGVFENEVPEYDDIFVKAYLGYDSTEEYEAYVRELMAATMLENAMTSLVADTWPVVLENTTVLSYPEEELAQVHDVLVGEVKNYALSAGVDFASYLNGVYGMTEEEFVAAMEESAKERVKEEMVVYAIARAENIQVSDEDYEKYASYFVKQYELNSVEELESYFSKEAIAEGVLIDLVKEFVANSAVQTAE